MTTLKMDTQDDLGALECPECGGCNLHHTKIEIYERGEDDDDVLKVTIADRHVRATIDNGISNPSRRRHGIRVYFWCETCGDNPSFPTKYLTIVQHKGTTYINWED